MHIHTYKQIYIAPKSWKRIRGADIWMTGAMNNNEGNFLEFTMHAGEWSRGH